MYKHARTAGWAAQKAADARSGKSPTAVGNEQRQAETDHAAKIRAKNTKRQSYKVKRRKEQDGDKVNQELARNRISEWNFWNKNRSTKPSAAPQQTRRQPQDVQWQIYVTSGTNPDGTLRTHVLKSRAEADQFGFTWAGRPSGSSR